MDETVVVEAGETVDVPVGLELVFNGNVSLATQSTLVVNVGSTPGPLIIVNGVFVARGTLSLITQGVNRRRVVPAQVTVIQATEVQG